MLLWLAIFLAVVGLFGVGGNGFAAEAHRLPSVTVTTKLPANAPGIRPPGQTKLAGSREEESSGEAAGMQTLPASGATGLDAGSSRLTHWYEPSNPLGLEVFTSVQLRWMADDAIGLRYTGPLRAPLADQLRQMLLAKPQKYSHAVLELDSDGGDLAYVKELVEVLQEVNKRLQFTTRVTEGSLCASGCIPLFMQGRNRKASGSSIWVFHGARGALTNVPDPFATDEYLNLLSSSGMSPSFRSMLETDNRIYRPGSFIFSGYELYEVEKAGIITELMPNWREEEPVFPSGVGPQ